MPCRHATRIDSQARANLHLSVSLASSAAPMSAELQNDHFPPAPIVLSRNHTFAQKKEITEILDDSSETTFCGTISLADVYLEVDERDDKHDPLDEQPDQRQDSNDSVLESFFSIEAVMAALEMFSACHLPVGVCSSLCCDKHSSNEASMQKENGTLNLLPSPRINVHTTKNSGAVEDKASQRALSSPASPDSPSLVHTETTTTTTISGTTVPSTIYILRRSIVPLDEPLDMPYGLQTVPIQQTKTNTKSTLFQRMRGTLRRNTGHKRDEELFERTLVQI